MLIIPVIKVNRLQSIFFGARHLLVQDAFSSSGTATCPQLHHHSISVYWGKQDTFQLDHKAVYKIV